MLDPVKDVSEDQDAVSACGSIADGCIDCGRRITRALSDSAFGEISSSRLNLGCSGIDKAIHDFAERDGDTSGLWAADGKSTMSSVRDRLHGSSLRSRPSLDASRGLGKSWWSLRR